MRPSWQMVVITLPVWALIFSAVLLADADSVARTQWEYKTIAVAWPKVPRIDMESALVQVRSIETPDRFHDLGGDGWELCSDAGFGRLRYYVFRRAR